MKSFTLRHGCSFDSVEIDRKIVVVREFKCKKSDEKYEEYENLIANGKFVPDGESFDNDTCEQCGDYNYSQKYRRK